MGTKAACTYLYPISLNSQRYQTQHLSLASTYKLQLACICTSLHLGALLGSVNKTQPIQQKTAVGLWWFVAVSLVLQSLLSIWCLLASFHGIQSCCAQACRYLHNLLLCQLPAWLRGFVHCCGSRSSCHYYKSLQLYSELCGHKYICKSLQNCVPLKTEPAMKLLLCFSSFKIIFPTQVSIAVYDVSLLLEMFWLFKTDKSNAFTTRCSSHSGERISFWFGACCTLTDHLDHQMMVESSLKRKEKHLSGQSFST